MRQLAFAGRWGRFTVLALALVIVASACGLWDEPSPTPIPITATPVAPVIPIVATETPSVTPAPSATRAGMLPTQGTPRTATPARPSLTPSFTPSPTDTPVTPGATADYSRVGGNDSVAGGGFVVSGASACTTAPLSVFGAAWTDPTVQTALGCPQPTVAGEVGGAYQPFENGWMIWVSSPQPTIYAFANDTAYWRVADAFREGDPESGGESPPAGRLEPIRGFGKVWREVGGIRQKLGWATAHENSTTVQSQRFERGEMIWLNGQVYVLTADPSGAAGTWAAR